MLFRPVFPFRALPTRIARLAAPALLATTIVSSVCAPRDARADAKTALPAAVAGFKMTKPVVVYNPSTLDNHIDGEAEAVKHYDFKQCAYAEYAPNGQGNQLITVDIFQFGAPIDAYGYFSGQRNSHAKVVKVGAEGYQEASALNFWRGPYYVRIAITASNSPASFQQAMPKIAQAVNAKLNGPTTVPAIIQLLPPGFAPHSEKYARTNVAAQSYINNGVIANYPSAGPQAELFIAVFPAPAAAKRAFTQYQAYLTKPLNIGVGSKPTPTKGLGEAGIAVKSKFSGEVVAVVKGKYLIGVRKATSQPTAQNLVKAALARAK